MCQQLTSSYCSDDSKDDRDECGESTDLNEDGGHFGFWALAELAHTFARGMWAKFFI